MPEPMESGATLLAKKEYMRAVPILQAEHEKHPNNPRIRLQYADALAGAGRLAEAAENYEATAKYYDDNGLTVQAIAVRKKAEKVGASLPEGEASGEVRLPIQRDAPVLDARSPQRDRVISAAEKLVAKGKVEAAIEEYSKLLDDSTVDVNTLNRIGDLWVRINRNDEAVAVFRKIADHYASEGFFLKAIAIYKKINKLDPSKLEVYASLAGLYAKQGLAMEAKSQYQVLADYYAKHDDLPNAILVYEKIRDLDPNSINVHVKLADLYGANHQDRQALEEYDRVARLLLKRGMVDEAVQVLRKAVKLDPSNVDLALSLATALYEVKDYLTSAAVLLELNAANPHEPRVSTLLARVHMAQGNVLMAVGLLQPLLLDRSADAPARELLAECYLRQNDSDRALDVLHPLAEQAWQRGDHDAAIELLQRILAVEVFHAPTQELLSAIVQEKDRRQTLARLRPRMRALIDRPDREQIDVVHYVSRHLGTLKGVPADQDAIEQMLAWITRPESVREVVLGAPGMGKTFLLRELALRLMHDDASPLPLLIELGRLAPAATIAEAIGNFLAANEIDGVDAAACLLLLEHGDAVLLLDDVDRVKWLRESDLDAFTKVVGTTRPAPQIVVSLGLTSWRLLPFTLTQIRNVLGNRWRNQRRLEQWVEILARDQGLLALCQNPSLLNAVAELDVERLFDFGKIESDAVAISAVYELLLRGQCARIEAQRGIPAYVCMDRFTALAVRMWETGKRALAEQEALDAYEAHRAGTSLGLVATDLTPRNDSGEVFFVHESLLEWLVASYVVEKLRNGPSPSPIGYASMSARMVEFFCDLAGYGAARDWATATLRRPDVDGHLRDNAQAVLRHVGGSTAPDRLAEEGPAVDAAADDPSHVADVQEQSARLLLAKYDHRGAVEALNASMEIDPARAARLRTELGFLLRPDVLEPERLRWCTDLWRAVTRVGDFERRTTGTTPATPETPIAADDEPLTLPVDRESRSSRSLGEELEDAVLRLFRQFFLLTEDGEGECRVQLQKLRKQKPGAQFGYDLAFEATIAGNENVRCHIECKNYSSSIALKDVADKLLQQESHGVHIDHWILISPRSNPSQDLHHYLEYQTKAQRFPFDLHVWCPETNIDQFFGLEPLLYDKFYADAPEEAHPRHWSPEKRASVLEQYRRILRPVYRLPEGWPEYVDEKHLAFSETEHYDFARTYQSSVPLTVKDHNGVELPGTAIERLQAWLASPAQRVAFVLGEFGDGKSFLTYSLSRQLLQSFRDDPDTGVIPLRLALREFSAASSVREFLQARLEGFGADPAGWAAVKREHRTLVILDGFDEISKELDPGTITKNIRALIDCCTAPVFDGAKILITSRTHFFETGDAARLLQRLENPLLLQLSRIPRAQVLGHLQEAAKGPEERELLQRLARMHDPIGLGTKPLFLQMLKETLSELPADVDEVSVYESYARKTLERKIELLDDPEFRAGRRESIEHLLSALGVIAEELQCSKDPYVSLKNLRRRTGPFAELLWRLTGEEELESDAEARIGTRSLLTRVNALNGDGQWLVDFCHRSIREYFVARQFAACLLRSSAEAAEFLQRVPVNHEILYFTACHLRRSRDEQTIGHLRDLLSRSRVDDDAHALGGRALTVLLRVVPALPRDLDFTGRNFDYADLEDSDLSCVDFSGSTFKGANFANTNLEEADLSRCDLTGVRLNETTSVLALAALRGGRIFAAYEDGTIWEWDTASGGKPSSRIVYAEPGLKLSRMGVTRHGIPWGIAGREALLFEVTRGEWTCIARIPLNQTISDFSADDRLAAVLVAEKTARCFIVDFEKGAISLEAPIAESAVFAAPAASLLCFRDNETAIRLVGTSLDLMIATVNTTALHAVQRSPDEILLAAGDRDGVVRVFSVKGLESTPAVKQLFERTLHSGPVLSLVLSESMLVSGGRDRRIALTPVHGADAPSRNLQLNIRCRGLKTHELKPETQRMRLEELMARTAAAG